MGASCSLAGATSRCSISSSARPSAVHRLSWAQTAGFEEDAVEEDLMPAASRRKRASKFCNTYRFENGLAQPAGIQALAETSAPLDAKKLQESLERSCRAGDFRAAVDAISKGADVHAKNLQGQSPLMLAAASGGGGSVELLTFLIDALAELEAKDDKGWTALHHACRNGRRETVEYLQERGALCTACTGDGKTCATLACLEGADDLVLFLISKKAKIDKADDQGWPLLLYACEGRLQLVKELLNSKANLKCKSKDYMTPFLVACASGSLPVCKYLVTKKVNINAVTKSGDSALMLVLKSESHTRKDETCNFLLNENIDVLHKNREGADARDVADDLGLFAIRNVIDKLKLKVVQADEKAAFEERAAQRQR